MQQLLPSSEPGAVVPAVSQPPLIIPAGQAPTALLERLIREVQQETQSAGVTAYNRMHNRHNRGR